MPPTGGAGRDAPRTFVGDFGLWAGPVRRLCFFFFNSLFFFFFIFVSSLCYFSFLFFCSNLNIVQISNFVKISKILNFVQI
jgi:hypothetical protein